MSGLTSLVQATPISQQEEIAWVMKSVVSEFEMRIRNWSAIQ